MNKNQKDKRFEINSSSSSDESSHEQSLSNKSKRSESNMDEED